MSRSQVAFERLNICRSSTVLLFAKFWSVGEEGFVFLQKHRCHESACPTPALLEVQAQTSISILYQIGMLAREISPSIPSTS